MKKVIFLDRDGVINYDSLHYIKKVAEFVFVPGSVEAIVLLTQAGYEIGVATNQSGVARGYYSELELQKIHEKMVAEIRLAGGNIAAIEYCPHHPQEQCDCRKPQPELLKRLARKLQVAPLNIPFVGDRVTDIQAAYAVGAVPIIVLSMMTDQIALQQYTEVPVFDSLLSYVRFLLKNDS